MISSMLNDRPKRACEAGFTFVELMIAGTLGSIVMAGVLTTFLMMGRTGVRVANYSMMETETRRAFEQLGIDARMTSAFTSLPVSGTTTSITLQIPTSDASTWMYVTYGYANQQFFVVPGTDPTATAGRRTLISNVTSLTFNRYDSGGTTTTSDAVTKHIQVSISVVRSGMGVAAATQVIRSTAFTMRNISI